MVRIDRVRRSCGGIEEAVKAESDRAADRNARRDAVKLDVNADLSGMNTVVSCFWGRTGDGSNTLNSTCWTSILGSS